MHKIEKSVVAVRIHVYYRNLFLLFSYTGQIDHFGGVSGVFKSSSYPSYTQTQCANTTLSSLKDSNLVIYMFVLDLDIGLPNPVTGKCSNDYLLLSYQCNNQVYSKRLCGTRTTELLFSTCLPTDKIFASYHLLSKDAQNQRGFALLYHLLPKFDPPINTTTARITTTFQPSTTSTSLSSSFQSKLNKKNFLFYFF